MIRDNKIIYGGGAAEIACSLSLSNMADTISTTEQYAIRAFGDALDIIPTCLAENSGYSGIEYLASIKKLADNIKVGQFFDFETLKRIASNNKNYDSLLFISTDNFNKMDKQLRDQKRGELSVLMITGAWLEGMHVATQVCKVKETKELTDRIGYEKINLDNI